MKTLHSTKRTPPDTELLVVTRIAEGVQYRDISEETAVPESTIKKIKARNSKLLAEIRQRNIEQEAVIVVHNLQKANRLLANRLDRGLSGHEDIPTRDLVVIAKEMFNQSQVKQAKPIENSHQLQEDVKTDWVALLEAAEHPLIKNDKLNKK